MRNILYASHLLRFKKSTTFKSKARCSTYLRWPLESLRLYFIYHLPVALALVRRLHDEVSPIKGLDYACL